MIKIASNAPNISEDAVSAKTASESPQPLVSSVLTTIAENAQIITWSADSVWPDFNSFKTNVKK